MTHEPGNEQAARWNGQVGRAWVDSRQMLDGMFKPLEDLLVDAVLAGSHRSVLDVGCGTGSTTVAIARRLGADGQCVGIDLSDTMIAAARARARSDNAPATFISGNAQEYPFAPAQFDMIVSRFGVMFFDEPVRAFANLRRAATEDARLRCIAWRSAAENPFMTTAERAAAPLLPNLVARRTDAPGQFAFADGARVATILEEAGWIDIAVQPIDIDCVFAEQDLVGYLTRLGPVGVALQEADDETRAQVVDAIRPAFAPFVDGGVVRYAAACWNLQARGKGR